MVFLHCCINDTYSSDYHTKLVNSTTLICHYCCCVAINSLQTLSFNFVNVSYYSCTMPPKTSPLTETILLTIIRTFFVLVCSIDILHSLVGSSNWGGKYDATKTCKFYTLYYHENIIIVKLRNYENRIGRWSEQLYKYFYPIYGKLTLLYR